MDRSHARAYFVALHGFGFIRLEQSAEIFGLLETGIEPEIVIFGMEDDGHAIVNVFRQPVGSGGNDGTGLDEFAFGIFPTLPQSGKGEGAFIGEGETEGTLLAAGFLPLIEAVGGDEAATLL